MGILPETLLAFLAGKDHLEALLQLMRLGFMVAISAVEPLLAAGRADGHLGVQDVFAVVLGQLLKWLFGGCGLVDYGCREDLYGDFGLTTWLNDRISLQLSL